MNQDYLGIKYNQLIDGNPTECVAITAADLKGNIIKQAQDPDFTYAFTRYLMGKEPSTEGLDPLTGMQSVIVYGTLPASQETFTAHSMGELYVANYKNYTQGQIQFARNTPKSNGIKTLNGSTAMRSFLDLGIGGIGIPMLWYPSYMNPNADGTLPAPSGTPTLHMVSGYDYNDRGIKIKPYLGQGYGQDGYVYHRPAALDRAYAFDPNAWRWMSLASIALQHTNAIGDILPQLYASR